MPRPNPAVVIALLAALALTGCGRVSATQASPSSATKKAATATSGTPKSLPLNAPTGGGAAPGVSMLTAGAGGLAGRVIDATSNRGVSGVTVAIIPISAAMAAMGSLSTSNAQVAGERRVTTDANGAFRLDGLPPGNYTFKAMRVGMQQISANGALVEANQLATAPDISMAPGAGGASGITSITYTQDGTYGDEGEAPAPLIEPRAVAVRGDHVLALDANHSMFVKTGIIRQYEANGGKFMGKFGDYSKWLGFKIMGDTVRTMTLDGQGRAVVLDNEGKLWRFSADGDKEKVIEGLATNSKDIATDPITGVLWVAHPGGLTKLNAEGESGQSFGTLEDCRAVAVGKDGVWAAMADKVQKLGADGAMAQEIGPGGTDRSDAFTEVTDLAVDNKGNLIVVDKGAKQVYVYDPAGVLVGKVGQGVFEMPVAVTCDTLGRVYVVDQAKKKIYRFVPTAIK